MGSRMAFSLKCAGLKLDIRVFLREF